MVRCGRIIHKTLSGSVGLDAQEMEDEKSVKCKEKSVKRKKRKREKPL